MNLADMLSYADIHQLSRIADHYQCECSSHSKNELIQSILSALNRRGVFEQTMDVLPLEDIRFLNSLIFDPRGSFSLEDLLARARSTRFAGCEAENFNPRDVINSFKRRGWLFNGHSHETKYLFQVPKDLRDKFMQALTRKFSSRIRRCPDPAVYREEQQFFAEDHLHLLRFVAQNDVPLTADGTMYKRALSQLLQAMSIPEEPVSKGGWRFGYGRRFRDYPDRLALLYDYAYYQGHLAEDAGTLALSDAGQERLESGTKEDPVQIYRFWLRLYKNAIPNMQSLVQWVDRLAGSWATVQSLQEVLCPLIKPFYYDSPESILEVRLLKMMMHLGMIRVGEDAEGGAIVRMTAQGSAIIRGTFVHEEDKIEIPVG